MKQLVENTRQGDHIAQARLYRQCYKKAVSTCQRIVGDLPLSEEIADDAFLVAFSKLHQLEDGHRFEPWLCQIARRLALRHLRRTHDLPTVPLEEIADVPEEDTPVPTEEEIIKAVESLPPGYRDVFHMSVLEGKSHLEIASLLGINPHSSSSQLARAKRMLRNTLRFGWFILLLPLVWLVLQRLQDKPTMVAKNDGKPDLQEVASTNVPHPLPIDNRSTCGSPALTLTDSTTHSPSHTDTIVYPPIQSPHSTLPTIIHQHQEAPTDPHLIASASSRWSFSVSCNMPTPNADSHIQPYTLTLANGYTVDNWRDYATMSTNISTATAADSAITNIAISNIDNNGGQILRTSHHLSPVEFYLSASYRLTRHWSIGTGIGLMQLQSGFTIGEGPDHIEQVQRLHFLNIPLGIRYHFFPSQRLSLYAAASATFHLPLSSTMTTNYIINGEKQVSERDGIDNVPIVSFSIGVGLQWNITPSIGIFAEPSLRYHCLPADAPASFLSQNPFSFSLPCGLHISF